MDATHASTTRHGDRRYRLAANDNETIVEDAAGPCYRLAANDNETIVDEGDDLDVAGHAMTRNDNEIVIEDAGVDDSADDLDGAGPSGLSNHGH